MGIAGRSMLPTKPLAQCFASLDNELIKSNQGAQKNQHRHILILYRRKPASYILHPLQQTQCGKAIILLFSGWARDHWECHHTTKAFTCERLKAYRVTVEYFQVPRAKFICGNQNFWKSFPRTKPNHFHVFFAHSGRGWRQSWHDF